MLLVALHHHHAASCQGAVWIPPSTGWEQPPPPPPPFKSFGSYFALSEADAQTEKRELFPFIWESGSLCLAKSAEEMLGVAWLQPSFPKKPLSSSLPARHLS